jgi:hypothetical protein
MVGNLFDEFRSRVGLKDESVHNVARVSLEEIGNHQY